MAGFLSPLELEYIDGSKWKVTTEFEYCVGDSTSNLKVIVPEGFITDFASVPKVFWNVLPPVGSYGKAAVVHDYLYQNPELTLDLGALCAISKKSIHRKDCDLIFKEAMEVLGVGGFKVRTMYWGVRAGGWKPYGEYRKLDGRPG